MEAPAKIGHRLFLRGAGFALGGWAGLLGVILLSTSDCCSQEMGGRALPPEIPLDPDAMLGSGRIYFSLKTADGTRVEAIADTGADHAVLDISLVPHLGLKLGNDTAFFPAVGQGEAAVYSLPKMFLGGVPLELGRTGYVLPFRKKPSKDSDVRALIGLDCLKHYCMQIDPVAGKVRFLDPAKLDKASLGSAIKMRIDRTSGKAMVPGFLGGSNLVESFIDTGWPGDGAVGWRQFQRAKQNGTAFEYFRGDKATFMPPSKGVFPRIDFHGQTYTNALVDETASMNVLGLAFLARHVATLDFPGQTLYLKRIDDAPIVRLGGDFRRVAEYMKAKP